MPQLASLCLPLVEILVLLQTSTFVALSVFWIIHIASNATNGHAAEIIAYISMQQHCQNMISGMFSSVDVVYYLLVSSSFILSGMWRPEKIRTSHY